VVKPPKAGVNWKQAGLTFAVTTAATILGVSLFNKMMGGGQTSSSESPQSGNPQSGNPQSGYSQSGYSQYTQSGYPPSGYPPSGYPPSGYPPSGYRRDVDHDKRADFFGEPHSSRGL
jgi:hypothetical protein